MTTIAFSRNSWAELERDEARFHRTLLIVCLPFILFGVLIPLWELTGLKQGGGEDLSQRYAELLIQQATKQVEAPEPEAPATPEEPEPTEPDTEAEPEPEVKAEKPEPKPEPKPRTEPQVDAREQAREKVQKKFASAFNALDSLREQAPIITASNRPLTQASSASSEAPSSTDTGILTSDLGRGSGGVRNAPTRSSNTSSTALAGRQSTQVDTVITASGGGFGEEADEAGFGGNSRLQGRSLEEIQVVMDRNKSGLYSLYNRALRRDATLQGKIVLQITIAPSGAVTGCEVVSSELNNPELENRIVRRVKLINFGAKDVAEMTIKYPIHFIPS